MTHLKILIPVIQCINRSSFTRKWLTIPVITNPLSTSKIDRSYRMNKDQMAVYLSEHLEFFNAYPELLGKIKSIDAKDMPIRRSNTRSLADRLIKRVQDDKAH